MLEIGVKIDEARVDGDMKKLESELLYYGEIGMGAIQISVQDFDVIKKGRLDKKQTKKIKGIFKDFDFKYSVQCPDQLNLMDRGNPALHTSVFVGTMEFASEIDSKIVVYHPARYMSKEVFPFSRGASIPEDEKRRQLDYEAMIIQDIASGFPEITICMQNAMPYFFHSHYCYAEKIELLKAQVLKINKDNVCINLDFGNLYMASKFYCFDPVATASELKYLIAHTHIHDNFGNAFYYHEKQQPHLVLFDKGNYHMPIGWGEVPINDILSTFVDSYSGMFILALKSRYFECIKDSMETLDTLISTALTTVLPRCQASA